MDNDKNMKCLRCGGKMIFKGSERLQLGQYGVLTGHLSNFLEGVIKVVIYQCDKCGRLEFFAADKEPSPSKAAQEICPECGFTHDFDYPKCPKCGHSYYRK